MFGETTISQIEISKNPVEIELAFCFRNKFEDNAASRNNAAWETLFGSSGTEVIGSMVMIRLVHQENGIFVGVK